MVLRDHTEAVPLSHLDRRFMPILAEHSQK